MAEGRRKSRKNSDPVGVVQNKEEAGKGISPPVMNWAVQQRDKLVNEAMKEPESDAGLMIHALLLNAIVDQKEKISEMTVSKLIEEQRRYRELIARTSQWKRDLVYHKHRLKLVKLKVEEAMLKIASLRKNHRPARLVDVQSILSTISAAIGVGEPLAPRVEEAAAG